MENQEHRAGFVNIIGKPNVGKSTLMNILVGEKLAIITAKAQTTRHRIIGIVNGPDFQIVYSDTPGILDPKYKLHKSMMQFVSQSLKDADLLLIMVDINEKVVPDFWEKVAQIKSSKIFIMNKIDSITKEETLERMEFWKSKIEADEYFAVSALHKHNVSELLASITKYLPVHPPYYPKDEMTDKPWRFFVSEIIREKIFLNYQQEIPYSTEVVIESYKDEEKIIRISAVIFASRKSQKPILIGHQGSKLKKVGTEARLDIEAFVGKKVFLELFVKVKENWRDDDYMLRNFGYSK